MRKIYLILTLLFVNMLFAKAQEVSKTFLLFENDKYNLTESSIKSLDSLISKLQNIPDGFEVYITGHTDSTGSYKYNMDLSHKRTEEVEKYLLSKAFKKKYIYHNYFGYTKSRSNEITDIGKQRNRRVEISIRIRKFDVSKSLGLKKEHKEYKFSSSKKKLIIYKETGTAIFIPDSAFQTADGKIYNGEVKIQYNEYRNRAEYLLANVPMQIENHDGISPMVSGGMFIINATDKYGNQLDIRSGKQLDIQFKPNNMLKDMFLWYRDTVNNSWQKVGAFPNKDTSKTKAIRMGTIGFDGSILPLNDIVNYLPCIYKDEYTDYSIKDSCAFYKFIERNINLWRKMGFIGVFDKLSDTTIFISQNKSTFDKINKIRKKDDVRVKYIADKEIITLNFENDIKQNELIQKIFFKPVKQLSKDDILLLESTKWQEFDVCEKGKNLLLRFVSEDIVHSVEVKCSYQGRKESDKNNEKVNANLKDWARYISKNQKNLNDLFVLLTDVNKKSVVDFSRYNDSLTSFYRYFATLMTDEREQKLTYDERKNAFQRKPLMYGALFNNIKNVCSEKCNNQEFEWLKKVLNRKITITEYNANKNQLKAEVDTLIYWSKKIPCYAKSINKYIGNMQVLDSLYKKCSNKMALTLQVRDVIQCFSSSKLNCEFVLEHLDSLANICFEFEKLRQKFGYNWKIEDLNFLKANYDSLSRVAEKAVIREKRIRDEKVYLTDYFSIQNMGMYNCDQIARLKNPIQITASYVDKAGKALAIFKIQLVDKQINSILEYNGYMNLGPYKFSYGRDAENKLIAYDTDGKAYYCEDSEFKKISGANHIFTLMPVPVLKTREELSKLVE